MKVAVISISKDRKKAEIIVQDEVKVGGKLKGSSETRHLLRESDGQYHWRKKNADGKVIAHETYTL